MIRIGPHIDPPLALVPPALAALGLNVFQTTLRDPRRLSKDGVPDAEDQAAFTASMAAGTWGMVHSSMLTSLGSPDPRIRNGSAGALASDANLAAVLGLKGVCFHVGYQKGHTTREAALEAVAYKLRDVLSKLKPGARVFLENGAEGTELGQTLEELEWVVKAVDGNPATLGVTLDTCHLHVAGRDMSTPTAADELVAELEARDLMRFMASLHLNDAQAECGSKRDRHAVPGQGTINEGLRRIAHHPAFDGMPAILEISTASVLDAVAYLTAYGDM
jgi:apurinic endonuclease APN1